MEINEALVIKTLLGENYFVKRELRYSSRANLYLSSAEMDKFSKIKEQLVARGEKFFVRLPLRTFNSKYCYYVNGVYLSRLVIDYYSTMVDDLKNNEVDIYSRHMSDMLLSRVFSEIEGTLTIENVPTTRKRIESVYRSKQPKDTNDIIIKNMIDAIEFIMHERPAFNRDNLHRLYTLLSRDCLDAEDRLREGQYYRDNAVYIDGNEGAPHEEIEDMMDSLFDYVANIGEDNLDMLPHICHYYILYVHPYFDYNGRTARMVSFWISYVFDIPVAPYFMSEAINECKKEYYDALRETRAAGNDLTYFLGYIMRMAKRYSLVYKNLEHIEEYMESRGTKPTNAQLVYIKKILVHNATTQFTAKDFLEYIGNDMSKQGANKLLRRLVDEGVLERTAKSARVILYRLQPQLLIDDFCRESH